MKRGIPIALPLLMAFGAACAQSYPERPIRLIVSYPPGGGTDTTARLFTPKLSELLGKQVIIENRSGAGSTIGTDLVAKAAPDGYTLHMTDTTFGIIPGLYPKLPFDALRDFQPITQVTGVPVGMVVHPSLPVRSVKDLIALARAKPGALNFGSGGVGTPVHMSGELLAFPDTPTISESGVPGVIASAWFGIQAPKGTPKATVDRLHAETVKAMREPAIKQRFESESAEVVASTPDEFRKFIGNEIGKWTKVVKDAGIKIE